MLSSMLFLRKLLKLPSPVDLGWSTTNALEMRDFSPQGKTWEDWHETVQQMHPVKYFIAETMGDFLRQKIWWRITRPAEKFRYWFVSHFVPNRRYHILDLRQPCPKGEVNVDCYKYGWRDVDTRMLFAIFNLLNQFVAEELPHYYCPTEEDVARDPSLKSQRDVVLEVNAIHHWWNVTRKEDHRAYDSLLHQWSQTRKISDKKDEAAKLFKILGTVERDNEEKVDEMIARLMKIRRSLWT